MSDEQVHRVVLTVRCERCGKPWNLGLRADRVEQFNETWPTFECDCGKTLSFRPGQAGQPTSVGRMPEATVRSSPHVRTRARGVWECQGCGQRWRSQLEGEKQDLDEAAQSNPSFACSCGSKLHLSEWIFQDAATGDAGEDPGVVQAVHVTRSERLVLEQLIEGKSNTEIAKHLSLSEGTVRNIASGIYRKLGVSNRLQAARVAVDAGLVKPIPKSHGQ